MTSHRGHGSRRRGPGKDDLFEFEAEKFFGGARRRSERKTQQLCRQVFRTLSCALAGECADELLQSLVVHSVEPAPDASRLLVSVYPAGAERPAAAQEYMERLARIRPMLRREVARDIVRKRAPELVFQVLACGEVQP